MRAQWLWVGSLALAVFTLGCGEKHRQAGRAEPAEKTAVSAKAQTVCPVMGNKIDKTLHVDHMGKRVYFCCKMCVGKFNKDPMKYIKKLEAEGVTLEKAPAGASGGSHKAMEDGGEHAGHAREAAAKAPAAKPQTICPIMRRAINKSIYVDHMGKRMYFCCRGCQGKARREPGKYMKMIEGQGVTLEDAPGAR